MKNILHTCPEQLHATNCQECTAHASHRRYNMTTLIPLKTCEISVSNSWFMQNVVKAVPLCSHPRPDVLDLRSDHGFHWVLVSIPVLSASVDHCTVGALNHIPGQRQNDCLLSVSAPDCTDVFNYFCQMEVIVFIFQPDSPGPSVDGQAKPRRVGRGRRFGNNYHILPSFVTDLRSSAQTLRTSSTFTYAHVAFLGFYLPCKCRCGCRIGQSSGSGVWLHGRVPPLGDSCFSYSLSWKWSTSSRDKDQYLFVNM